MLQWTQSQATLIRYSRETWKLKKTKSKKQKHSNNDKTGVTQDQLHTLCSRDKVHAANLDNVYNMAGKPLSSISIFKSYGKIQIRWIIWIIHIIVWYFTNKNFTFRNISVPTVRNKHHVWDLIKLSTVHL